MKTEKTYNILVTGVGAIIGYGILKNLRHSKFKVKLFGIDIYNDAIGQAWCDKFIQGVMASSESFIPFINTIIENESIDLVIPGIEQDLATFIFNKKKLSSKAVFVLNNESLHNILSNKKESYFFLKEAVPLIESIDYHSCLYIEAKKNFGLPFILKKYESYASKGVALINNLSDYKYYSRKFENKCMAQKRLNIVDNEYTCSVFGLGDGSYVNPTCLKRELSQEGATKKAKSVLIDIILLNILRVLTEKCKFSGPTNLQFIKEKNNYYLLEINPRTSSSTSIRRLLGVNEAEMCIEFFLLNTIPEIKEQKSGSVIRFIEDYYFDSNNF